MLQFFSGKTSAKIVITLFVILLIASGWYYQQRVIFVDTGWMIFNILNRNNFLFGEYRYGVFITQLVPLVAGYLHVPLKGILIAYSLSFQVFYLGTILLLIFRYKQLPLAILMAFYFTLFVSDAWFWPHNEVHQGMVWMFLFLGLFLHRYRQLKWYHHLFLLASGFLAIFSHFIVIIPFSYLWICYFLVHRGKGLGYKPFLFYTFYLSLVFVLKYKLGANSWYDGAKLTNVKKLTIPDVWHSFSNGQAKTMGGLLLSNYWAAVILLIAGIVFALRKKSYFIAALTIAYAAGYFSLVCLTYPDAFGRATLFYMESEWMALGIIAGGLFVFKVMPHIKPAYLHIVLSLVLLTRLAYIFNASALFTQRIEKVNAVVAALQKQNISKAVIIKSEATDKDFLMDWGAPVESLIWSSMNDKQKPVTYKIMPGQDITPVAADTFLSCFDRRAYRELNSYYFKPDTVQTYRVVEYNDLIKGAIR